MTTQSVGTIVEQLKGHNNALTADELSILLNVSKKSIYKQIAKGTLPSFRIGTAVRFCGTSVARWLEDQ